MGRRASIPLHALTTLLSALGAFCLFEPRVARICPGNLRYICSDDGNASQGADNTSVRARGVFCLCEFRVFSTNLNILRSICSGHGDPARRAAATAAPDGSRGSTHAPHLQRPVASEDKASACSELRLGCHPETPVIEPCLGRDGLGARREECPVACESDETKPAVMEKRQNKANFALALVYEWFAVRTHNGDIELGKQSRFGRLVVGGPQVDRGRMSQGP